MTNWRKPVIHAALRLTGSDVLDNLRTIRRLWRASPETVERYQRERLAEVVRHAHATVPYYDDVLEEAGVVDGGDVHLERYDELPLLTRETVREQRERLRSTDPGPEPYTNTSGGTTGEPVVIVQDQRYWEWNVATKLFYQELAGKPLGGREVKLWGSERDLEAESVSESLQARAINFLYNRRVLNSYRMGDDDMRSHVEEINAFRPRTIWAYVESIHRLASFVERNGLEVHSPAGILSTAGTLHEPVRETIETAFGTRVHDQYGSREVGDVACECAAQDGLHVFPHTHYVEIVDEDGTPKPAGENGRIAVTSLTNYSMPLLRYEIGDMGVAAADSCRCGRPFPTLEGVTGRVTDHFRATDGDVVHPGYLRKTLYHRDWIEKYRIRQTSRDHVVYSIERRDGRAPPESDLAEIESATRTLLGDGVEVTFEFPERIEKNESGKFRYTVSEVVQ